MNDMCPKCGALHFSSERLSRSTINEPQFGMCCLSGQVVLPNFPPAPRELRELFDEQVLIVWISKQIFASIMLPLHSHPWVSK